MHNAAALVFCFHCYCWEFEIFDIFLYSENALNLWALWALWLRFQRSGSGFPTSLPIPGILGTRLNRPGKWARLSSYVPVGGHSKVFGGILRPNLDSLKLVPCFRPEISDSPCIPYFRLNVDVSRAFSGLENLVHGSTWYEMEPARPGFHFMCKHGKSYKFAQYPVLSQRENIPYFGPKWSKVWPFFRPKLGPHIQIREYHVSGP